MTTDDNDDRCGLAPVVTPRWDPYRKRMCHWHDKDFDERKKSFLRVTADAVGRSVVTAAIGAYAVALLPVYVSGLVIGGAVRWFTHDSTKE
jgi:hypothetical protein